MRPLLWKEMRDLRLWVVAGALLVGTFELLSRSDSWQRSFEGGYLPFFMPVLLTVAAVGLGAGQVARERHARSLDYLLTRPISPTAIVWAKFLAGTVALALLVVALVGFGFRDPSSLRDSGERMIREQVGFQAVALALFPRYWFVYTLTLFFSVLVDRAAKVAAMMTVIAITVVALAGALTSLAPFSRFVYWLPYFDLTGALVTVARTTAISAQTGVVFSAAAVLSTAIAAVLLKRSPERYVGNLGLIAIAAGFAGAAVLSAHAASVRFPATPPVGSWSFEEPVDNDSAGVVADGDMAAVVFDREVRFVDFSNPAKPLPAGNVAIPLFSSESFGSISGGTKAAMGHGAVFVVGQKKAVPVDLVEVAMVKPAGELHELVLAPVRPFDFVSRPVLVDHFLYLAFSHGLHYDLRVFDTGTQSEVASLPIEDLALDRKGPNLLVVALYSRDGYVYMASSASLTTVDVRQPARPVVTNRIQFHPQINSFRAFLRKMAWQGDRLFETSVWPQGLLAYDLRDPAHPAAAGGLVLHGDVSLMGSGEELYQPWQQGILEFHGQGDELRGQRYLSGGRSVNALAMGGQYLFALSYVNDRNHGILQAYR